MSNTDKKYRVLARKYRPSVFADLVGQEALVRTLKNAIETGRLAQAYILTGIRGIGKTTSARIIARGLNCIGPDGTGGMTSEPCGVCEHCRAIAEDRHVDVVEIDAASNNGVDNVREIIETTRYNPTSARFKVYIIDEVHMLTKQAFNALLKTLEEPPERVKFIFATTEIRKVPTTVLSRCQRFDLRRVEVEPLSAYFKNIVEKEGLTAEEEALRLIARAADGSVRDGLSLLDQAIAHGGGNVTVEFVRAMIGLADRAAVFDLYEQLMKGAIKSALDLFNTQYDLGAEPLVVLQDLLDLTHWLTRVKIAPELSDDPGIAQAEREKGAEMAKTLSMAVLTRNWQILLKGIGEVVTAPSEKQAAEMILIRLAFAAELPSPADVLSDLRSGKAPVPGIPQPSLSSQVSSAPASPEGWSGIRAVAGGTPMPNASAAPQASLRLNGLADIVAYAYKQGEMMFAYHLENNVSLVHFEYGKIEFYPLEKAPKTLANEMSEKLREWTGIMWGISIVNKPGGETLVAEAKRETEKIKKNLSSHPFISAVIQAFPSSKIDSFRLQKGVDVDLPGEETEMIPMQEEEDE